jgi:hypothetical protein
MFHKCANPKCTSLFDYREGQLIRVPRQLDDSDPDRPREIKHFWLCGECASRYVLEYRGGKDVVISPNPIARVQRHPRTTAAA